MHTTNGGATWVNQQTGVNSSVSVYVVSPTTAWIGGIQDLALTTDGGAAWTIERPSNTNWFRLTFLDKDNGWAGGQDQDIDDVPGSIWKRSGRSAAPNESGPRVLRPGGGTSDGVWKAPPSKGALGRSVE